MTAAAVLLLLALPARASTWTVAEPLDLVLAEEGHVVLPAGTALRLEPGRKADLPRVLELPSSVDPETGERVVVQGEGIPVDLRGIPTGLLVPATETTRLLVVEPGEGPLRVRTTTRREELASWLRVEQVLVGGRGAALDALELPWGQPAELARMRLRARAVGDRAVRALGAARDLAPLAPLHRTTHAAASERSTELRPGEAWSIQVAGPATAVLAVRPRGNRVGAWVRGEARLRLDERELEPLAVAGSGGQQSRREIFVPPGEHTLELALPELEATARLELVPLRPTFFGPRLPGPRHEASDPVSAAELAWLREQPAEAATAFRALLDVPGPAGELARVRLLRLEREPQALLALARLPPELSADGLEACVDAVLDRASELPVEVVEAAVLRAAHPDLAKVASWLDGLGGLRPRGAALLQAARPLVDDGRDLHDAELQHRTLHTRFRDVDPEGLAAPRRVLHEAGPGVPRVAVDAGEAVELVMPEWGDRRPVLRMLVEAPAEWLLDGKPWRAEEGELAVGLAPGTHRLEVREGTLVLMDREVVRGGRLVHESTTHALPATWSLPDPGVRVDLRLRLDPPVPVRISLDDGAIRDLHPDPRGVVDLPAGAHATQVEVEALADPGVAVHAALQVRTRRPAASAPPPEPIADVDAALAELADLSRAMDLGYLDARLARAALLGRMGLLGAARRDLVVLLSSEDPALREQARARAENLLPPTPSAPAPGPVDVHTAMAAHSDARALPAGPSASRAQALEEAAAEHAEPALWLAAAEAWQDAGEPVRAWAAAERAGPAAADLRASLQARTTWSWLRYAEGGVGLVRVPEPDEDPEQWPLWRRAREAMLAPPWPVDEPGSTTLRGEMAELLSVPGGELLLDLYCRDEQGLGEPCTSTLRLGARRTTVEIPDGAIETVVLPLQTSAEVEIGGPGDRHALVVRARVDGAEVGGDRLRSALRASRQRPVQAVVGGPALVRIAVLQGSGEVLLDGAPAGVLTMGEDRILAVPTPGPHRVQVQGAVDVRLYVGTETRPRSEGARGLELPPDLALPVDLDALLRRHSNPAVPDLRTPGRGGSVELGLSALHDLVYSPRVEPWTAAEATADWLRSQGRGWVQAGAWGRGLEWAGGAHLEGGPVWSRGFAGLRADAAVGAADRGSAGEVGATARARHDLSLGRTLDLRLDGRLRAAWLSPQARLGPVDNRAWSRWRSQHPVYARADVGIVGSPTRDLRWELALRLISNTGPSLDRLGPVAGIDLLLPTGTVLSADGRLELRLVDEYREEASLGGLVQLRAEHGAWERDARWWRPWAEVGYRLDPAAWVASGGLRVLMGPARGLRDLPPGSVSFRSVRDLP